MIELRIPRQIALSFLRENEKTWCGQATTLIMRATRQALEEEEEQDALDTNDE